MKETCIYCTLRESNSRDHFPPKLFLRKPFPPNLRTVPACAVCNGGYSMDEEYYRLIVVGLFCFGEAAEAVLNGPIARSFDRNSNLEDKMFNSIGMDGEKPFVATEGTRLTRIAQKMALAVHYIETGYRPSLQSWYSTEFFPGEPVPNSSRLTHEPFVDSFAPDFRYKFRTRSEDKRCALLQITHFDEVHWLGLTRVRRYR